MMIKRLSQKRAIKAFAERCKPFAKPSANFLFEPKFDFNVPVSQIPCLYLTGWGTYSTPEPNVSSLHLLPVSDYTLDLLVFSGLSSRKSTTAIFGMLPWKISRNSRALVGTLVNLFGTNGSTALPLLRDLPTFVVNRDNTYRSSGEKPVLRSQQVKELLWYAIRDMRFFDLDRFFESLEASTSDPLSRTSQELVDTFGEGIEFGFGFDYDIDDDFGLGTAVSPAEKMSREQFEKWYDLASDEDHVRAEARSLRRRLGQLSDSKKRNPKAPWNVPLKDWQGILGLKPAG
jgi:hypothetical protein